MIFWLNLDCLQKTVQQVGLNEIQLVLIQYNISQRYGLIVFLSQKVSKIVVVDVMGFKSVLLALLFGLGSWGLFLDGP